MTSTDLSLLFGLAAIWGASFMFIKVAVQEMSPIMLVSVRLVLAAASLLLLQRVLARVRPPSVSPPMRKMWKAYVWTALVNAVIPYSLIAWGEELGVASGVASILNATTPLFTALLVATVVSVGAADRLTPGRLLGLLIGFAGVAVLVTGSGQRVEPGTGGSLLLGQVAVLTGAFAYGVAGLYARKAFAGVPPIQPAIWQNVFGAIILLPVAWTLTPLTRWPSWQATGSAIVLGIGGTAIALLMYYELIARVGATRTLIVTYLLPVTALIYGAVLLDERVGIYSLLGLLLVLLGIAITVRAGRAASASIAKV